MSIGSSPRLFISPQLAAARPRRPDGPQAWEGERCRDGNGAPSQPNPTVTGVLFCCCCFSYVLIWMLHIVFLPPPGKQRVRLVYQKMFSEARAPPASSSLSCFSRLSLNLEWHLAQIANSTLREAGGEPLNCTNVAYKRRFISTVSFLTQSGVWRPRLRTCPRSANPLYSTSLVMLTFGP